MACEDKIHPLNVDPDSQPLGCSGVRFDDKGMVLPHSVLGSLDDFRSYLEAKGDTEFVKRIPNSPCDPPCRRHRWEAVESGCEASSDQRNMQSNALQNWHAHMMQRRRQQDYLSGLLNKPAETLIMNQTNHYREIQEQREFLKQVKPFIHSGYSYRVGNEFWSVPQHYGDEMSGISATLTRTEQGRREPVTHVGQPSSICQESGAGTVRPGSRTWGQGSYLQQQYQELGQFLPDTDMKKPDISALEVIGSGKPFTSVTVCHSPLVEKEAEQEMEQEEEETEKEDNLDPENDEAQSVVRIPALRFCGHLAPWTGNSATRQGEVGISTTIFFEAVTGEIVTSHLKMNNEGSTAIFYSWQRLPLPRSFHILQSKTKQLHFLFNSSSGVILPGDTLCVAFIFKSEKPGIETEIWQLNTHPMLLQGASMRVTLRGVSLYQDKTADQRHFIKTKLEKTVMVKVCKSIVSDVLRGVRTPERPSSPAELYITEEERFLNKNPKLQYRYQPVEDLKRLWQKVKPELTWDLSVDSLQQVVLSLPEQESPQDTITREKGLAQLNSLLLELSEPSELKRSHLSAAVIGQQLWVRLLDRMADEAMWLRSLLGLPERETGVDKKDVSLISDADLPGDASKDEKHEEKGGAAAKTARSASRSKMKDDNKEESKSPTTEKSVEEGKKRGKRREDAGKLTKEKQRKESVSLTDPERIDQPLPDVEPDKLDIYKRLLHKKVYALMEDLVDTLCDLMNEGDEEEEDTRGGHIAGTEAPLNIINQLQPSLFD
uniref:MYCBP-associated protein-like n=1 Tax=Solea senegalensis TaxID=28829 RepID=UPI001CD884EE|nr:MYCBP-associated protein-like [Solea senegalensis]